ncbi:MAG: class IV adenylate cyclase [Deltaproteobacteria bacterium]|nr:class IV adenylate cyclase [Deltaproteobacteria bacterium]
MLEIEIKAVLVDPGSMKELLGQMGAVAEPILQETDYYYQHPSRDFGQTHEALRLRITNGQCRITYKGPRMAGTAKIRFEAETEIGDYETMKSILERLDFRHVGVVEKERAVFYLEGATVCLDDVVGLGTFIELEKMGEDKEVIEQEILALAGKLGIKAFEPRTYLAMILSK